MHRLVLVLVIVAGCKKTRKQECDELADLAIRVADELGKQLGGKKGKSFGKDPEIKAKMDEFRAQCMKWPDEVFECMKANDETSPKCVKAMEHVTGVVETDTEKAPVGPAVAARATVGKPSYDGLQLALADDGSVVTAPNDAVVAFDAKAKETWRTDVEHTGWMLALESAIVVEDRATKSLVALDRTSGKRTWSVAIPQPPEDEYTSRHSEAAVRVGESVFVASDDGIFYRLDPAACTKAKQKGCLVQAFKLDGETFDAPKLHALGQDILIAESDAIRRISTGGKLLAKIHVRDTMGGVSVLEDRRVAATFDDELVVLDLAKCSSRPVELGRKKGRMYIKGEGECEDCVAPPAGCAIRAELSDVSSYAPVALRDGSLVVDTMEGIARVAPNGNKHWVSSASAVGEAREVGDTIVFVSNDEDDHAIVALETATGRAKWRRPLELKLESYSDVSIEQAGKWLVAGADSLAWINVP